MKQTYFIDSENVNDLWVNLLDTTPEDAKLLVFYTKGSPHMSYASLRRLKESPREVTFIKCYEGTNALDFQLVTELGYRLRDAKEHGEEYEMILVSNDNGFSAAVSYWTDRGMSVRRINGQTCSNLQLPEATASSQTPIVVELPFEEPENESVEEETSVAPTESVAPQNAFPMEEVNVVIRCLGKKNLAELYNALVAIYGDSGKDYYAIVKPKSYKVEPQAWKLKEKIEKYAAVVFANVKESMPTDFAGFLQNSRDKMKNLNSFRAACTKQYGKEKGANYYAIIKPHVKWIASMN